MKKGITINQPENIEKNNAESLKKEEITAKNEDKLLNLIAEIIVNIIMEEEE
jgi:hypothetical protein